MILHNIFRVDRSGADYPLREAIALDESTPRGLFKANDGTRFVVCDHPLTRFAVALEDGNFPAFSLVVLDRQPIAQGQLYQFNQVHLGSKQSDDPNPEFEVGDLRVENEKLMLVVLGPNGWFHWETIAYGMSNVSGSFDEWTLMTDEQTPFFGIEYAAASAGD